MPKKATAERRPKKAPLLRRAKKSSAKKAAKKAVEKVTKRKATKKRSKMTMKVISVSSPVALQNEIDKANQIARYPAHVEHLCTIDNAPWFLLDWQE